MPPSLHRYLYAYANPTVYIDLYGYASISKRPEPIETGDEVYFGEDKVYWVQDNPGELFPSWDKYYEIGRPGTDELSGKPVVYLTEELGGGVVSRDRLDYLAEYFDDRKIVGDDTVGRDISGLNGKEKGRAIKSYLNYYVRDAGKHRLAGNYQKTFLEELDPIDAVYEDYVSVKHGTKRLDTVAGDYAFDAVLALYGEKITSEVIERSAPYVLRYLEKKFGKKVVQGGEKAIEEVVEEASKNTGLDWDAIVPEKGPYKGQSRPDHVRLHNVNNPNKAAHGVFFDDGVTVTNEAWAKAQKIGLQPNSTGKLTVPMDRQVGWMGGKAGEAAVPMNSVTIIVKPGTNQVITAYPDAL